MPTALRSVLLALAVSRPALAQDPPYAVDLEIARPAVSYDGLFAVDSPRIGRARTWTAGATFQYQRAPLRLFEYDNLLGYVIAHRSVVHLAWSAALSRRVALGLGMPFAAHSGGDLEGTEATNLPANGVGVGDFTGTVKWLAGTFGPVTAGLSGTLSVPTGNRTRYMGERLPRLRVGALTHIDLEPFEAFGSLHLLARAPVETEFDLTVGSEIHLDLGVRRQIVPELDVTAELLNRVGIALADSGGRLASELLVGARYRPGGKVRLDFSLGRGLTEGPGTTAFRIATGLTFVTEGPEPVVVPEPKPVVAVTVLPEAEDEEPPPLVLPPEPEPARVVGDRIEIDDPIRFAVNTADLLPESGPILQAVADLLANNGLIGHLVIEGHASAEGSYDYNYDLSVRRAAAIYRALLLAGVHPSRMSYRGMGEVASTAEASDEEPLAEDRRVQFHIVRVYVPGEEVEELTSPVALPWSGEPHEVAVPKVPEPPKEAGGELDLTDSQPEVITLPPERPLTTPEASEVAPEPPAEPSEEVSP